jgi:uncharacterized protein YndB with AHSA1/START domain
MAFATCVATAFEQRRPLPVDPMVPDPLFTSTHAITIDAPPDQVWPWIAQMGAGRAGWYSWDAIDNGGTPSARRVVPELQTVVPGDVMPAVPRATNAFVVASVDPPRDLVLTVPDANGAHAVAGEHVLEPIDGGQTRLVVRGRASAHWLDLARAQPAVGHHRIFIERAYALLAHLPRPLLIGVATFGHRVMEARHLRGIQRRSTASGRHIGSAEQWRQALLTCGILAPVLYIAMTLLVGLLWEGYSVVSRVPSELSAIGAPTRPLWIWLGMVYAVLMIAFGWIVWTSAPPNRALRVVGALLMAYTVFGQFWPPMHQRAVLAAGGGTLTDTLHLVWAMITGFFFMLIVGFGAAALGKRFRVYSIATMVIGLACGAVTGTYASQVQADLPTPWVGVWERISIATFMAWIAVLATALLRAPRAAATADPPTFSSIPGRWTRSVRATPQERTRALPGDELIENPIGSLHHAITIGRPRHEVWPWLVQMGAGSRAGWYSYDFLDNGRRPSAIRIIPELQQLAVGMIFPAGPGVTDGFTLLAFEPERFLTLGWTTPEGGRLMTWAFVLEEAAHDSTRLIVRARVGPGARVFGLPWWAANYLVSVIHFPMQRKQLIGLARRAELTMSRSSAFKTADRQAACAR